MIASLIQLAIGVLLIVSMWKIFEKLGEQGWKAIVPIYNIIVLMQILKWDLWKIVFFFIPIVNLYFAFLFYRDLAAKFGKGSGYAIGILFLSFIFLPMLAFKEEVVA